MNGNTLKQTDDRRKGLLALFAAVTFATLYLFFTKAHPLYIHDLDDWFYLYVSRNPLPSVNEMNPIKVLPETWMVMSSYVGAYVIYPLVGDYTQALGIAYAILLSGMITLYGLGVAGVLRKRYELHSSLTPVLLAAGFLMAHFLPFIMTDTNNLHLFYAQNVTCVFNYTLPALMNLILFTYFADQEKAWKPLSLEKLSLLLLALYFTIFSNLFHSVVLMSLFGMQLLFALIEGLADNIRSKKPFLSWRFLWGYIQVHYPKLLALIVWLISMVFQMGGRGDDMKGVFKLMDVLNELYYMYMNLSFPFKTGVIWINAAALLVALYRLVRYRETKFLVWQAQTLGCICLIIVYLILIIGRIASFYMSRPDVVITWMSLVIFGTVSAVAYLVKQFPKAAVALPLAVFVLLMSTVFHERSYAEYNVSGLPAEVVQAVNQDIIGQVLEADAQGLTEVDVYIPESMADGWPLDMNLTPERITDALYCHGITSQKVNVTILPSSEKDAQFYLDNYVTEEDPDS